MRNLLVLLALLQGAADEADLVIRGATLIDGTGKRPFVPPCDPRHPNHRAEGASRSP